MIETIKNFIEFRKYITLYKEIDLTNSEKTSAGLRIDQNISTKTLNTNLFDLRLIYNKRTGFSDSYGFSVTIVKK
jgi:hypothetical protein